MVLPLRLPESGGLRSAAPDQEVSRSSPTEGTLSRRRPPGASTPCSLRGAPHGRPVAVQTPRDPTKSGLHKYYE